MGRILKDLIDDVELIIVNIFQTGIKSVSKEMFLEIEALVKKCNMFSLSYVANELENLYKLLSESRYQDDFDFDKITKKVSILSQSVMILKKKINYDSIGGY